MSSSETKIAALRKGSYLIYTLLVFLFSAAFYGELSMQHMLIHTYLMFSLSAILWLGAVFVSKGLLTPPKGIISFLSLLWLPLCFLYETARYHFIGPSYMSFWLILIAVLMALVHKWEDFYEYFVTVLGGALSAALCYFTVTSHILYFITFD